MSTPTPSVQQVLSRRILFVSGKGGVGKTLISQAIARAHAQRGARTLWVTFEDPTRPPGELRQAAPHLWELNCTATEAFEEYISLKIKIPGLTQLFLRNKVIQFLSQAGPGIHELVLLGKLWHEREEYDHIIADMPSTGYGLAMFQSVGNWSKLFQGGPIFKDAEAMLKTFGDHQETGQLIVSLPEEMPLRESLELDDFLCQLFPQNRAAFIANRLFTDTRSNPSPSIASDPVSWPTPIAESLEDYFQKRLILEKHNLDIWRKQQIPFTELPYLAPDRTGSAEQLAEKLTSLLLQQGLVP